MHSYEDYLWKEGFPYGIRKTGSLKGTSYKVVSDPYWKRVSIEEYREGHFLRILYDSALFDFRTLTPAHQTAWEKESLGKSKKGQKCIIRNQDDRIVLIEEYAFVGERCRVCHSYSPHGLLISTQKIFYTELGDPFNGVTLYDAAERPVMVKKYNIDEETGAFGELIDECWDMTSSRKDQTI